MEQQQEQPQEPQRRVKYYQVVRFYQNAGIRRRNLFTTNSLAIAQGHCANPNTSSRTCTTKVGKDRTRKVGDWFDGYETVYY